MVSHNLALTFIWDDGNDTMLVCVMTPESVTKEEVIDKLREDHNYLCDEADKEQDGEETEDAVYGTVGRTPETLIDYSCKKHGWEWKKAEFETIEFL